MKARAHIEEYAISALLNEISVKSGLTTGEFMTSLGYRNLSKGFRRFDTWLQTGYGDPNFILRVRALYGHTDELREVVAQTIAEIKVDSIESHRATEAFHRRSFEPIVWAVTEREADGMGMALTRERFGKLRLPVDLRSAPLPEQLNCVVNLVREHFQERDGKIPIFGPILGYRFRYSYDDSATLGTDGAVIDLQAGPYWRPVLVPYNVDADPTNPFIVLRNALSKV